MNSKKGDAIGAPSIQQCNGTAEHIRPKTTANYTFKQNLLHAAQQSKTADKSGQVNGWLTRR